MNLPVLKNLFLSGPAKILGLILAISAALLTFELLAVLLNLPEHNVTRMAPEKFSDLRPGAAGAGSVRLNSLRADPSRALST